MISFIFSVLMVSILLQPSTTKTGIIDMQCSLSTVICSNILSIICQPQVRHLYSRFLLTKYTYELISLKPKGFSHLFNAQCNIYDDGTWMFYQYL